MKPNLWIRLLRWFCSDDRIEEVEGDLFELFNIRSEKSPRLAKRMQALDVIRSFRWVNIKKPTINAVFTMYIHFAKASFRSLIKDYRFSLLNVVGLSLGLAVFLLSVFLIRHEYSFDQFHQHADRTYQVIQVFQNSEGDDPEIFTSLKLAQALSDDMTSVEEAVTVHGAASTWVTVNDRKFFEEDGIVASSSFWDVFDYELIKGQKEEVLKASRSIVIDEQLELKYFGGTSAMGKEIELERYGRFTVTGVMAALPNNSTMQFNYVITQDYDVFYTHVINWFPKWFESWDGDPAATFIRLKESADPAAFRDDIAAVLTKYKPSENINPYFLVGLADLHFGLKGIDGRINQYLKGDRVKIRVAALIGSLILLLSIFNYVNISTARASRKAKEVGVRKSLGASKLNLRIQYLLDAGMIVTLSTIIALIIAHELIPYFNRVVGTNFELSVGFLLPLLPGVFALMFLITVLAGFYPAWIQSNISAIKSLKGLHLGMSSGIRLRNFLVTTQFTLVLSLVIVLINVNRQHNFIQHRNLGFDTDATVVVEINGGGVRNNYQVIKERLKSHPNVYDVTGVTRMLGGARSPASVQVLVSPDDRLKMRYYGIDDNALDFLGMHVAEGTGFDGINDENEVLVNQVAAKQLGNHTIGSWIEVADLEEETIKKVQIVGVLKDFHYTSLHDPIGPLVVGHYVNPFESLDDIVIKIGPDDVTATLTFIEAVHNDYDENDMMSWAFLDDMIQSNYEKEAIVSSLIQGGSCISLIVALLGLIGLTAYNIRSRVKEFAIRKIMGASFMQLFRLQGNHYLRFLILSWLIASSMAYFLTSRWLDNYTYQVAMSWWPYLLSIISACFLIVVTVLLMGFNAIQTNPADELRDE
ncbi:MAG: ABC transporter permease [Cyclobacteriaceae bacterium]